MIPIPIGKSYNSTVKGWVWRAVRCEHCGCEYAYNVEIVGHGFGSSPLFLNNQGARAKADRQADENYYHQAETKFLAVDCPECGGLQQNMVDQLKANRWRLLIGTSMGFAAALLIPKQPYDDTYALLIWLAEIVLLVTSYGLWNTRGRFQSIFVLGVVISIFVRLYSQTDIVPFMVVIGVGALILDAVFASRYDPRTNRYRVEGVRHYQPEVVLRANFDAYAAKVKTQTGKTLQIPHWP